MTTIFTPIYLIGMWLYSAAISIAALFNSKAKLLARGRKETWRKLAGYDNTEKCIWIHVASLGEFEQGRPLIEAIKEKYPQRKIVVTFFSPSGYEIRKNYAKADLICYLPADGPHNARRFVEAINPEMAFFIKYEYWHFFLNRLKNSGVPVYGVSMIYRRQQSFFKWYGAWFRQMLALFAHIYIQDKNSAQLLDSIGIKNYTVAGDTRFDRVAKIAATSPDIELARRFAANAKTTIVAGSTWPPDEDLLLKYIHTTDPDVKLIIAPHEVDKERIKQLCSNIKTDFCLYTDPAEDVEKCKILVINTIGLLSGIYKYGNISYIGGGFGKGIHNTLEAATYGMPVIFGPNYKKFKEACDLIDLKAAFTIKNYNDIKNVLDSLRSDLHAMETAQKQAAEYVKSMCGTTDLVMNSLFK